MQKINTYAEPAVQFWHRLKSKIRSKARANPFLSLFSLLAILVICIVVANLLRKPATQETTKRTRKIQSQGYRIGTVPVIHAKAQIEKSGVVNINALAGGIVSNISVKEGQTVTKGTTLLQLSSSYQGGNAPALQFQLASRQLQNANDTYESQKTLIQTQKDIALKTEENAEKMREISRQSAEDTRSVISLNNDIIQSLDAQINAGTNVDSNRQIKSQYLAANNQLNAQLRSLDYTGSDEKIPSDLSKLQKDAVIKQLDLQEKALDLQRDVAHLQYQLAVVQQQTMIPAAPFKGTVQRIFVRQGQLVTPGMPLFVFSQVVEDDPITAVAYIPHDIAQKISVSTTSKLHVGPTAFEVKPSFISQEPVKSSLHAVYFDIPDIFASLLSDKTYIDVELPVGISSTGSIYPFVPVDAVYQNENASYVFLLSKGKAMSHRIELGPVYGSYVQILNGLEKGDVVLMNRNVTSGDAVSLVERQ